MYVGIAVESGHQRKKVAVCTTGVGVVFKLILTLVVQNNHFKTQSLRWWYQLLFFQSIPNLVVQTAVF